MKDIIEKENCYFKFYYTNDSLLTDEIENTLINKWIDLSNKLRISQLPQISVYIYPTLEDFHSSINLKCAPDWIVGCSRGNSINVIAPYIKHRLYNFSDIVNVMKHELVHIFLNYLCVKKTLTVLSEGLATFEAQQDYLLTSFATICNYEKHQFLTFEEFCFMDINNQYLYPYSYCFTKFLIENCGYNTFIKFLKDKEYFLSKGKYLYNLWMS